MRTNVVIDDELMRDALAATGARTKREVVERGLQTLIRLAAVEELRSLRGQIVWEGDLDDMRTDKVRSTIDW